ncbi:MAG: hypothetical protein JRF59_03665 [Deltaproteobacteria bacterium]|nr:hypothetical protein [Deltaproteobacteria bacterium]RLB39060.1 MAG: hypothetical protein DRH20_04410 [Deltaproteobacteria bacterium]
MMERSLVIELAGIFYRVTGREIESIVDLKEIEDDCWFITDFGESVSRTATVESAPKYVEVMVRKSLQEAGEFDEPVSVVTHWKKKKGPRATDIFYTALPTRRYYQYLEDARSREASMLIFPLYAVLFGVLKKAAAKGPCAVVFQHGRFADMVIGTPKRTYYSNRCVAFDEGPEQIESLWHTVREDIRNTESDHRIQVKRVLPITWVDTVSEDRLPGDLPWDLEALEGEAVRFEGRPSSVSFLGAVRTLRSGMSVSGRAEKTAFLGKKALPFVNGAALLAALVLLGAGFWAETRSERIRAQLRSARTRLAGIGVPAAVPTVEYEGIYRFIRELDDYAKAPSFGEILDDLDRFHPDGMAVELLEASYGKGRVEVKLYARIQAPFLNAYKGYQRLCRGLRRMGYQVETEEFDTTINRSRFLLRLEKGIK